MSNSASVALLYIEIIFINNKTVAKMAEAPSRTLFTGEQVLNLLDSDVEEYYDGEIDEVFLPGSDDELRFVEEEMEEG